MRSKGQGGAAFSRIEICVVLANLILLTLVLIPAFRPPKSLELAPAAAPKPPPAGASPRAEAGLEK